MDSHALAWPLDVGLWTAKPGVAARVGVMESHASVWPLEVVFWIYLLWHGPSSWVDGLPCFGVPPHFVVMPFHALVWPLD